MGNEWINKTIEDIAKHQKGFAFKSKDYQEVGCPVVRVSNFTEDSIDCSSLYFVSEKIQKETEAVALIKNDVVIATVGSWPKNPASIVGKTIRVPLEAEGSLLNQNAVRLRASGCENFDQIFLYYLLKDKKFSDYIVSTAQGSANQASITLKDIYGYSFDYPSDTERRKISEILDSLDNKIQLNRETNQTLEAMAQALFKSWFVDFDPVFDNIIAHNLAHNNAPLHNIPEPLLPHAQRRLNVHNVGRGSARQTAAHAFHHLFPQAFEQSDEPSVGIQGWVPKGWGVKTLADITTELRRGISPKYAEKTGIRVINQKCIRHHEVNYSLCRLNDPALRKIEGRELEIGDVLVNSTGVGTLGRVAPVKFLDEATVVDSHVTVVRSNPAIYPTFVFAQLMIAKEWEIEALGEGSTGQTELSRKILSEQTVLCPNVKLLKAVDNIFEGLADKSVSNSRQLKELESLRDTLLPKLISGELRIPDAEQATEALAK